MSQRRCSTGSSAAAAPPSSSTVRDRQGPHPQTLPSFGIPLWVGMNENHGEIANLRRFGGQHPQIGHDTLPLQAGASDEYRVIKQLGLVEQIENVSQPSGDFHQYYAASALSRSAHCCQ